MIPELTIKPDDEKCVTMSQISLLHYVNSEYIVTEMELTTYLTGVCVICLLLI